MKAFQYSMQRLLDVKITIEEARQARLAGAIRDLEREKQRLVDLVAEAERAAHSGCGAKESSTYTMELRSRYVDHVRQLATKCAHRVVLCEQAMNQCRSELTQATMERESFERLRDREEQAWRLNGKRSEQKEMDETALRQHNNKRHGTGSAGQNLAA